MSTLGRTSVNTDEKGDGPQQKYGTGKFPKNVHRRVDNGIVSGEINFMMEGRRGRRGRLRDGERTETKKRIVKGG